MGEIRPHEEKSHFAKARIQNVKISEGLSNKTNLVIEKMPILISMMMSSATFRWISDRSLRTSRYYKKRGDGK